MHAGRRTRVAARGGRGRAGRLPGRHVSSDDARPPRSPLLQPRLVHVLVSIIPLAQQVRVILLRQLAVARPCAGKGLFNRGFQPF